MQKWDSPLRGTDTPLYIGSITGSREFINAKLAGFTIYEGALSSEQVANLYDAQKKRFEPQPEDYPEDDLFRMKLAENKILDNSEMPGAVERGEGVTIEQEEGKPVLALDGKQAYLILNHHPRAALLHHPFTLVMDFKPAPEASGMIFRRHHHLCLALEKDGTLVFDANIGRRNMIRFPEAVKHGDWNRLRFSYDGKTAEVMLNNKEIGKVDYPGSLAMGSNYPLVFFADNTHPNFPGYANIQCKVREFRIMPLKHIGEDKK
jgi:hypothetical protein